MRDSRRSSKVWFGLNRRAQLSERYYTQNNKRQGVRKVSCVRHFNYLPSKRFRHACTKDKNPKGKNFISLK